MEKEYRSAECFKVGYMVGLAAALDSLSALTDKYTTDQVEPFEALNQAAIELNDWLFGDAGLPSVIKTDVLDELPVIVLDKTAEAEIKVPPGVDRLRGVTYSDNDITPEMAANRDEFFRLYQGDDEGDDLWRSRMDPRTDVTED